MKYFHVLYQSILLYRQGACLLPYVKGYVAPPGRGLFWFRDGRKVVVTCAIVFQYTCQRYLFCSPLTIVGHNQAVNTHTPDRVAQHPKMVEI